MDFRVVTLVVMLSLTTPVHGRILERDTSQRATCTAPVATKGETAVVTCHYPLDVEQPGETVSITVERYPFTSSGPGSPEYILDCEWNKGFTCSVDKAEYKVEGKKVVITIKNVNEDSQGHYLCKMIMKGPIIHGEACQLRLNGTNPSDLSPPTTDPGMDQPTTADNVTSSAAQMPVGHIAAIVVGCSVAVAAVVVAVIVWKKCSTPVDKDGDQVGNGQQAESPVTKAPSDNDDDNCGNGPLAEGVPLLGRGDNQRPNPDSETPGAGGQPNNGDVNHGNGQQAEPPVTKAPSDNDDDNCGNGQQPEPPERQQLQGLGADNPEEEAPGDNDDDKRGNGPPVERVPLLGRGENQLPYQDPDRPGARDERNNGDVNHGNGQQPEPPERQQLQGLGAENPKEEAPGDNDDDSRENGHPPEPPERQQLQGLGVENPEEEYPGDNDDDNRGNGLPAERVPDSETPGAGGQPNNGDVNHNLLGSSDDRPESWVGAQVNRLQGERAPSTSHPRKQGSSDDRSESWVGAQVNRLQGKGAPSTSHPRASNEMEKTEEAHGEEETDERQERKQDEEDKDDEENVAGERQEKKQ